MTALLPPWSVPARVTDRARYAAHTAANVSQFAHPLPVMLRLLLPRLRVLCHPRQPSRWQILYKICALNGYQIVSHPSRRFDVAIHFADGCPCALPPQIQVLNRRCTDVSKAHVAAVFGRIFRYPLSVEPLTHRGRIVEKSDANYTHDGRILEGPLDAAQLRAGRVYQRLIDSTDGGYAVDLRTPVYGGRVPLVYVKRRPLETRFANENTSVEIREPHEIYSSEELALLSRFAAETGVDFGELDVLRDRDGRIYVVDVANLPAGPPNGLAPAAARIAVRRLAREFARLVSRPLQEA